MYEETFLAIGVAIVTRQQTLWEYQVRIVMPYWFINYDLTNKNKCNLSCLGRFCSFAVYGFAGLIYESSQQKLG